MGKTIVLISSKGGSGKSTVAVGLATAFSSVGKSVLLIDADEGARCLDSMLNVDSETVFDISDVLKGNTTVGEARLKIPKLENAWVVPSPQSGETVDLKKLTELAEEIKQEYDYVVIDTKGQLPFERFKGISDSVQFISVVTPDKIAVRNTGLLNASLNREGHKVRLIINRFKKKTADRKTVNIDNIIDEAGARLIGVVPEDKRIGLASGPLSVGTAACAVFRIAARTDGKDLPLPDLNKII